MKLYQQMASLPAHCRLLLSGTPVQNSLQEMWALFNFVQRGLLGERQRT